MEVQELTREQLDELKSNHIFNLIDSPSYGDIADAPETISDAEIFECYNGTQFCNDDFLCSAEMR